MKLPFCLVKYYVMKIYGGVEVSFHVFIVLEVDTSERQLHASTILPTGKETQGSMDGRLDEPQKWSLPLPGSEPRYICRPAGTD
jgi:hypothetical protein